MLHTTIGCDRNLLQLLPCIFIVTPVVGKSVLCSSPVCIAAELQHFVVTPIQWCYVLHIRYHLQFIWKKEIQLAWHIFTPTSSWFIGMLIQETLFNDINKFSLIAFHMDRVSGRPPHLWKKNLLPHRYGIITRSWTAHLTYNRVKITGIPFR